MQHIVQPKAHQANGGANKCEERRDLQQCSELPEKEIQVRPAKDVHNILYSSEDRDPRHGFKGNRYILLEITDVMYTCLKEKLIYFEDCVDFASFFCCCSYPCCSRNILGIFFSQLVWLMD